MRPRRAKARVRGEHGIALYVDRKTYRDGWGGKARCTAQGRRQVGERWHATGESRL